MSEEETKVTEFHRLSEAEIAQLAVDIVEGRVFITNTEEGIRFSFMLMISMLDLSAIAGEIGAFYEEVSKALPRGINGYPMFTSMKILHREDFALVIEKCDAYEEQRKAFVGAPE